MRTMALAFLLVITMGCTRPNPRNCAGDGICSDPEFPFCDVDGAIAGTPDTCIAGQCAPSTIVGCQGDDLVTCNANGTNFDLSPCEFGCQQNECNACAPDTAHCNRGTLEHCGSNGDIADIEECVGTCVDDPDPRCTHIIPRYVPNACDELAAAAELVVSSSATFDTDLDATCNGGVVLQAGAANICVVRYGRIHINTDVELVVTGSRALALVSDLGTTIDGYLDLSAGPHSNGPGGGTSRSGGRNTEPCGGMGGAGFATRGGHGGNSISDGGSSNGGPATIDPATLTVLVGGPQANDFSSITGGGGGAATLVACRGQVTIAGEVNAGGGGGQSLISGYGGGAGGYVVVQGMRVVVTGKLFANGGGGGGSGFPPTGASEEFMAGHEGSRDLVNDNAGLAGTSGARGGRGGVNASVPSPGGKMPNGSGCANTNSGGGGGGSIGFFQTYTPGGIEPVLTPTMASPMPRPNANVPTR